MGIRACNTAIIAHEAAKIAGWAFSVLTSSSYFSAGLRRGLQEVLLLLSLIGGILRFHRIVGGIDGLRGRFRESLISCLLVVYPDRGKISRLLVVRVGHLTGLEGRRRMGTELKRRERGGRKCLCSRGRKERTIVMDYCGEKLERIVGGEIVESRSGRILPTPILEL